MHIKRENTTEKNVTIAVIEKNAYIKKIKFHIYEYMYTYILMYLHFHK